MADYAATDQVSATTPTGAARASIGTWGLPNFVGELFKLSPMDTPLLSMIGGLTGGESIDRPVFTWQDTIHRAPAVQDVDEGQDATFSAQKRQERKNVVMIHQYGVELTYTKQSAPGLLGSGGDSPSTAATSILGNQPIQDEMSWQLQIKIEQAALDVELAFLTGTYAFPNDGQARQTQGLEGAGAAPTYINKTGGGATDPLTRTYTNELAQAMFDEGAPFNNVVYMVPSAQKVELTNDYAVNSNWNIQPRSHTMFGVNATDLETDFVKLPIVVNRHMTANSALIIDLSVVAPVFMPIKNRGHFFLEPLASSGAYDRMQLYGEIGLKYGPTRYHGRLYNLNTV